MVDITHKSSTLRKAIATAVLNVSRPETIEAILQRRIPKGDVFEFARAAGLLAVKKTSDVIPDCHPLPVEYTAITYEVKDLSVIISVEVHTIYKTGVEVEAMHGASVTALVMYDMLKPVDKGVEIGTVRLASKTGGKSDAAKNLSGGPLDCAVVVCSDTVSQGINQDSTGRALVEKLESLGFENIRYQVVADEVQQIQHAARALAGAGCRMILFTGGTGLSMRDVTPEAIAPLIDTNIPGIMETARRYGQDRMPYAMLSRGVSGFIGDTLVLTLPGSRSGALETVDALFPAVLHVFKVRSGSRHE